MSFDDEFEEDMHSHTFRGTGASVSARGRRPTISSGPTLSGQHHWRDADQHGGDAKEPSSLSLSGASFTQQYASLQAQQDGLGSIGRRVAPSRKGLWHDAGSTVLGGGGGGGGAHAAGHGGQQRKTKIEKKNRIQNTYQTPGKSQPHGTSPPRHQARSTIGSSSQPQFLPAVSGAEPPPVHPHHGLPWQAPPSFPATIPPTARPPNLMAWVKSIGKLDTHHPEQRGYYVTGDMMARGQEQYLNMEELKEKYAQQYAQLAAQHQQQQLANPYPTPDQFQQFFLAQQADQAAAQRAREESHRHQAVHARSQNAIAADNPTLSLTWSPSSVSLKSSPSAGSLLAHTHTASQAAIHHSGPTTQTNFTPHPPPPRAALSRQSSAASLRSAHDATYLSSSASQSSIVGLASGGDIILKSKGLTPTQRRQQEHESKEAERIAAAQEEKRLANEARELREHQQEQARKKAAEEQERMIVLKHAAARKAAAAEYTAASAGNTASFEFMVSPARGPLHQSLRPKGSELPTPTPPPMPTFHASMSQPTLYVHSSTSQPLPSSPPTHRGMPSSSAEWTLSTASLPTPAAAAAGNDNNFFPRSASTITLAPTTGGNAKHMSQQQLTSYDDLHLNSSRVSIDLDAPRAASGSNKVILNITGKDLPHDKNIVFTLWRKVDARSGQSQPAAQQSAPTPADDLSNWDYIGSTELIASVADPAFDRTFILDAPLGSSAFHGSHLTAAGALVDSSPAASSGGDMQLLALTKKKHRLFSGHGSIDGRALGPTIFKVEAVHVFHPDALRAPAPSGQPSIMPHDTHLLKSPPTTSHTASTLPQSEIIGTAFFILEQVVDQPTQEFKLQTITPTSSNQLNQNRRNQVGIAHTNSFANSNIGVTPAPMSVSGSILVQVKTIGILVPIDVQIACTNLPPSEWMHKCDPIVVVYAANPNNGKFSCVGHTSRFRSTPSPIFPDTLTLYSYSHCDRSLRFAVYDSELGVVGSASSASSSVASKVKERDLLGEVFVSLDELIQGQDMNEPPKIEVITSDGDTAETTNTGITFRLLKGKKVVRVGHEDAIIAIKATIRPIILTNNVNPPVHAQHQTNESTSSISDQTLQHGTPHAEDTTQTIDPYDTDGIITIGGAKQPPHTFDEEYQSEATFGSAHPFSIESDHDSFVVQLSISCTGLPNSSQSNKLDPIVTLFMADKPATRDAAVSADAPAPTWRVVSQTERCVQNGEPVFHRILYARLPLASTLGGAGDMRIAVYDSDDRDHVRYHGMAVGSHAHDYLVDESRLIGEHFFNIRILAQVAQQQQRESQNNNIYLDLVKNGRIVLRRKGAIIKSTPDNLNANGAAQFVVQIINADELPPLGDSNDANGNDASPPPAGDDVGNQLVGLAQSASPASSLLLSRTGPQSTPTSQIALSVSARGITKKAHSTLAPVAPSTIAVLSISNPSNNNTFEYFAQTERRASEYAPAWQKVFLLDKEIANGDDRPWLASLVGGSFDALHSNPALLHSPLELKVVVFDVDASDIFQHGEPIGQAILPLASLVHHTRQDVRLSHPETGEVVGSSVITLQTADVGQVTQAFLAVACHGLPRNDWTSKCDPVTAVYAHNPFLTQYTYAGQTERIRTTSAPMFRRLIPIDLYGTQDRPLRFAVYDTDADETCTEQNLLGECFLSLKQLQSQADLSIEASRVYEESLLVAQSRDGKHGGMVLPQRPDVPPGLFVKLATKDAIDLTAKAAATARTHPLPYSVASSEPADSLTDPAQVYVQLVYSRDAWSSELESGLDRSNRFQRKVRRDRQNLAEYEEKNATTTPTQTDEPVKSTQTMLQAGQPDRALAPSATHDTSLNPSSSPVDSRGGVTDEVWQTVWSFTTSKACTLFSDLPNGIQVTTPELVALLEASKNSLPGLMFHLKRFNEASRKFKSLREIVPAIHMAIASNTHVSQDVWQVCVRWLTSKECRLFSDSQSVQHGGLNVTIQQLDQAIVEAHGVEMLLQHLKTFNLVKRKFEQFDDLLPAILITQRTGAHVTDEIWQAIRAYLSNPAIGLFRKDVSRSELKLLKRAEEQKEAQPQVQRPQPIDLPEPTPRKKPANYLSIDENVESLMKFSPSRSNMNPLSPSAGHGASSSIGSSSSDSRRASVDIRNPSVSDGSVFVLQPPDAINANNPFEQLLVPAAKGEANRTVTIDAQQSGEFMLIQMKGSDVDECIIASDGSLNRLLLHLQRFDDVYRKFTDFGLIAPAIRDMQQCKSYAGSAIMDDIAEFVNDRNKSSACTLFSESRVQPTIVDGPALDHMLNITGSVRHLKELLHEFDSNRRKFNKFADLIEPVQAYVRLEQIELDMNRADSESAEDAARRRLPPGQAQIEALYGKGPEGYPKASPLDRKELVTQLSGPFLVLFGAVDEFRLTHGHLDAMLYEAGGLPQCIAFLEEFVKQRKYFHDVDALISAIAHTSATDKPVPDYVWEEIFRFLTHPNCQLFPKQRTLFQRGDTSGLQIRSSQLSELLLVPNGLTGLMIRLHHLNSDGFHFNTFEDLMEEMRKREFFAIMRQHGHTAIEKLEGPTKEEMKKIQITNAGRMAVLAYLSSRDSKLIYHVGEIRVDKSQVDQLMYEGRGLESTLDHLHALDRFRRMFGTFAELIFAVRVAHHRGYHITEAERATLITYLSNPRCLLFSEAKEKPIPIIGNAIDDIMATCDGNINAVLVHLRQLDRVGRRFQRFDELSSAISLASHSQTHISDAARISILSYLSSDSCHLFSESGVSEQLVSGPVLDSIFLDNPGKNVEEILISLRKFDALNRSFQDVQELVKAIKRAFKSGSYIDEQTRQTIIGYLMSPNVHLMQGAAESTFTFSTMPGAEIDDLFLAVNGSLIELFRILKQINDLGKTYTHLGSLTSEVSRVRAKLNAKKAEDIQAAMSITGTIGARTQQQQAEKDPNTTYLTFGGGSSNPLLMSTAPLQSQLVSVYHYDENAHYNASNPPRISDEVFESLIAYLTRPSCKLFSKSNEGLAPNRSIADRLIWVAGGLKPLLKHFDAFNGCARYFTAFSALLPAVVLAEKNHVHLLDIDQNLIIDLFNHPETTIFKESGLVFRIDTIPGETLDALVLESGGVAQLVTHVRAYSRIGRKFNRMAELLSALGSTRTHRDHLSDEVRQTLLTHLYPPSPLPIGQIALLKPGLQLVGPDLDDVLGEGNGLESTLVYLDRLRAAQQQFATLPNLLEGIRRTRHGLSLYMNISSADWSAVVSWLTSPANHIFSNAVQGVTVDGPTLDTLLLRCGGIGGLLNKLRELDSKNIKLLDFSGLLDVIPEPPASPQPIAVTGTNHSTATMTKDMSGPVIMQQTIQAHPSEQQQEAKYDEPSHSDADHPIESAEVSSTSRLLLAQYFSHPDGRACFPSLVGVSGDVLILLNVSDSSLRDSITLSGGTIETLLTHLTTFTKVGRTFQDWPQLIDALKEWRATSSHVTDETRTTLLTYLSSPDCSLFSSVTVEHFDIDCVAIDDLLSAGRGLASTLNHLRILDACGRKASTFPELVLIVEMAREKGVHVTQNEIEGLRHHLVSSKLFEQPISYEDSTMSNMEYDRFYACSGKGGITGLRRHFEWFQVADRRFASLTSLLVSLERVVGGESYILESSRESLIEFLNDSSQLFDSSIPDVELTSNDLDRIIFVGQGLETAIGHMKNFIKLHRTFMEIEQLVQAIETAHESGCHLAPIDATRINDALSKTTLLSSSVDSGSSFTIVGSMLDELVLSVGGSVPRLIQRIEQIAATSKQRFETIEQLLQYIRQPTTNNTNQIEQTTTPSNTSDLQTAPTVPHEVSSDPGSISIPSADRDERHDDVDQPNPAADTSAN